MAESAPALIHLIGLIAWLNSAGRLRRPLLPPTRLMHSNRGMEINLLSVREPEPAATMALVYCRERSGPWTAARPNTLMHTDKYRQFRSLVGVTNIGTLSTLSQQRHCKTDLIYPGKHRRQNLQYKARHAPETTTALWPQRNSSVHLWPASSRPLQLSRQTNKTLLGDGEIQCFSCM